MESVIIPNGVELIDAYVFDGDTGLKNVTISNSVTKIGEYAFYLCSGLKSIIIPDSVTEIGGYAFGKCVDLTIYGNIGSTAEKYAKENNITFKPLSEFPKENNPADTDTDSDNKPTTPQATKTLYHGNVDGDETVTSADALIVLRASVGLEKLTEEQKYFADVNGDGNVDSADSLAILRWSVGLKDKGILIEF